MNARDELARAIFLADNVNAPAGLMEAEWDGNKGDETYAHMIADGLLGAGYRKLEPAWLGSLEHDHTHEFVYTSHCDGEHIARWRRTPELSLTVKASPWEIVEPEPQP
jgi:hypothetical protein